MDIKHGTILSKEQLKELRAKGFIISMFDKDKKADVASIGVDKYSYRVTYIAGKTLEVERID